MAGAVLKMQCVGPTGVRTRELLVDNLVIAGWTGRDRKAMEAHIEELAKLGVPRPATTITLGLRSAMRAPIDSSGRRAAMRPCTTSIEAAISLRMIVAGPVVAIVSPRCLGDRSS